MRRSIAALLGALALAGLAACETRLDKTDIEGNPIHGFVPNPQTVTETTDWSQTRSIELSLAGYVIKPDRVSLQQGQPYRLAIENQGKYTCYFASEGLLKSIAVDRLTGPTGTKTFPYYEEIVVLPGETRELYFVPVRAGNFEAECASLSQSLLGNTIEFAVAPNPAFVAPVATQPGAIYSTYDGSTGALVAQPPAADAPALFKARIRAADAAQLDRIKIEIRDLIALIREREAQLGTAP